MAEQMDDKSTQAVYLGNIGNVYSVAISPNGNHIAVGGWTGYNSADENIYIYWRDSGEIFQVIRGLPFRVFAPHLGAFMKA